jgi:hypothetical protein
MKQYSEFTDSEDETFKAQMTNKYGREVIELSAQRDSFELTRIYFYLEDADKLIKIIQEAAK